MYGRRSPPRVTRTCFRIWGLGVEIEGLGEGFRAMGGVDGDLGWDSGCRVQG